LQLLWTETKRFFARQRLTVQQAVSAFRAAFAYAASPSHASLWSAITSILAELAHSAFRPFGAQAKHAIRQMARSAKFESEVIAMEPGDAWLLEKLGETKAQRKAAAFGRRPISRKERLDRFRKNGLPTRLEFREVVR